MFSISGWPCCSYLRPCSRNITKQAASRSWTGPCNRKNYTAQQNKIRHRPQERKYFILKVFFTLNSTLLIGSRFLAIFTLSCRGLSRRASYLCGSLPSNNRYASRQAAATKRSNCEKTRANFKKRKTASNSVRKIPSESTISASEVDNKFYFAALCYSLL